MASIGAIAALSGSARAAAAPDGTLRVLAIDGGGIRGVAAARILDVINEALVQAGKPGVADYFHLFAGTSTGSIIAAGLAANDQLGGRFKRPSAIESIYRERGKEIFVRLKSLEPPWNRPRFRNDGLKRVLHNVFGDIGLSSLKKDLLATYFNLQDASEPIFALGGPDFPGRSGPVERLSDVIWASCSAPVYFNPARISSKVLGADGGLFANNPAGAAVVQALTIPKVNSVRVVSVGCGLASPTFQTKLHTWGAYEWMSLPNHQPAIDAFMRGQAESTDALLRTLLNREGGDVRYLRFQFNLDPLLEHGLGQIDDVREPNLDALTTAAKTMMAGDQAGKDLSQLLAWPA